MMGIGYKHIGNKRLIKCLCLSVFFINIFFSQAQNTNEYRLKDSIHAVVHRLYEPMRDEAILYAKKNSFFIDIGPIFRTVVLFGIERKWNNYLTGNVQIGYYRDDPYNFGDFIVGKKNDANKNFVSDIYAWSKDKNSDIDFATALEMKYKFNAKNDSRFIKFGYRLTSNTKMFSNTYKYLKNDRVVEAGLPLDYRIFANAFYLSYGKEIVLESKSIKFEPAIGFGYRYTILNGSFSYTGDDLIQRIENGRGSVKPNCACKILPGSGNPIYTEESTGSAVTYSRLFVHFTVKIHFYYGKN
jgi:hypothetical protein